MNNKSEVNIILLFINYDEDGDLKNVEYFIIKNFNFTKYEYYTSETNSSSYMTTQKNFITKFMDEMKENLVKNGIFEKLLILAGFRKDISTLTSMMKKGGYKIPQIFQNNVIELFEKDFNGIMPGDSKSTLEMFYTLYLADDTTIKNKIKIINNM